MALFQTLLFCISMLSSTMSQWTLIWYDDMGKDRGDWTLHGGINIDYPYDSSNCQTGLCARLVAKDDFVYMERQTNVADYTSLRLIVYIKESLLESDDYCQIWYKYPGGDWVLPTNGGEYGEGHSGNITANIPSSSTGQSISIAFEIDGDANTEDKCYFDNAYLYGIPRTNNPTISPTNNPTLKPTNNPTPAPTEDPTSTTMNPTPSPTSHPTPSPTDIPSINPTRNPTNPPTTAAPTSDPTVYPTKYPTVDPTDDPTSDPTIYPTEAPTWSPSKAPTNTVLVIRDKPTIAPITETTESAENNDGDKNGVVAGISSNGFIINWYYFIIGGSMLIICCVAMCWCFYRKKKQSKLHNTSVNTNEGQQGHTPNVEMLGMERLGSVSAISSVHNTPNNTSMNVGCNWSMDDDIMLTPMGPTPIGSSPIGSSSITRKMSMDLPQLPTENETHDTQIDDGEDDELYLRGTATKQTPNVVLNEEEDEKLYVENEEDVTTAGN